MANRDIGRAFPNLDSRDYFITSDKTPSYNCVAWAFKDDTKWWQPPFSSGYYWPDGMSHSISVDNFINLFEIAGGYAKCGDASLEEGQEKVAIYQTSTQEFSHVARQKENGIWTSKLGKLHDIDHVDPFVLEKDYGPIVQFLKRHR